MSSISKFLENEIDRVNDYLGMAAASLTVPTELCEDNCKLISSELDDYDQKVIDYLNENIPDIMERIAQAKELIGEFKDHMLIKSASQKNNNQE